MKKALLLMAAFVGILAFSSCEKEEITKPANNNGNSTESFRFVSFEALNEITDYWGVYFVSGSLGYDELGSYTGTGFELGLGIYSAVDGDHYRPEADTYRYPTEGGTGFICRTMHFTNGELDDTRYHLDESSTLVLSYPTDKTFSITLKGSIEAFESESDIPSRIIPIDFTYTGELNIIPYENK